MTDSERFAVAARLGAALKRSSGRVVDVLWLMQDDAYAREVLRLARAADTECGDLAFRYEHLLRERQRSTAPAATAPGGAQYVRGLR